MNAIGADPNDWDKHFKLMADLDLSAYTGDEFNMIGSDAFVDSRRRSPLQMLGSAAPISFTGVFDGNGHTISNLTYVREGESYLGLFRHVNDPNAEIRDLGLIRPRVDGETKNYGEYAEYVGSLVGFLSGGTIRNCYASDVYVSGERSVGGLVGRVRPDWGDENSLLVDCYATGIVIGNDGVGGLVGSAHTITGCYADAIVRGHDHVGGLAGWADTILNCYAQGTVVGNEHVGGLAGSINFNDGDSVTNCYATALVLGATETGGLVGHDVYPRYEYDYIFESFWDVETTRQATNTGGKGKTTAQMQMLITFLAWGEGENEGVWTIDDGNDYPRLAWENRPGVPIRAMTFSDLLAGTGMPDDPYLIYTPEQMDLISQSPGQWDKHYKLMADIDFAVSGASEFQGIGYHRGYGYCFKGTFDGNGHTILNFTCVRDGQGSLGLFLCVSGDKAEIKNLGLINPAVHAGGGWGVGALVGKLEGAAITSCYVKDGTVSGGACTGGLVGRNERGAIMGCYSSTLVFAGDDVGGLVGRNEDGIVVECYATGLTMGESAGALVGRGVLGVEASFWDVQTTGQDTSDGGTGLTTAEMMTAVPFLEAGWDFVGEDENGTEDIWWIDEGRDYPRLWWEDAGAEF